MIKVSSRWVLKLHGPHEKRIGPTCEGTTMPCLRRTHDISPTIRKSRLGSTTSNQRGKNNRNSGNTHRLRLPRQTNWWGPQGRWWPWFSGMQTKSSTTGGLPEKGHMITWAYWADLLRHLGENQGDLVWEADERCSSTRTMLQSAVVLADSNGHLIRHPQTTIGCLLQDEEGARWSPFYYFDSDDDVITAGDHFLEVQDAEFYNIGIHMLHESLYLQPWTYQSPLIVCFRDVLVNFCWPWSEAFDISIWCRVWSDTYIYILYV